MVNEQKRAPHVPRDVISPDDFAPLVGAALERLRRESGRVIYLGEHEVPQAVVLSITEYDRLRALDTAHAEHDEARFQEEVSSRAASGQSLPLDDPAELFASIGFEADDEAAGPAPSSRPIGDER